MNQDITLYAGQSNTGTQLTQLILDSSPLAIVVVDRNHAIIDCNGAALKLFGASSKTEVLENFFEFSVPIQPNGMFSGEYARELVQHSQSGSDEITAEWLHRDKAGGIIPCEVLFKKIDYFDTYITIVYIRDLRAEIAAQAAVKEVTERNKIMIDATPICFVYFDDSFNIVDCNRAALALFGVSDVKEFAERFYTLSPEKQKDGVISRDSYRINMQTAFNTGHAAFEWDHLTASGEKLPVDVTLVRVEHKGSYRLAGYFRDLRDHRAMLAEMQSVQEQLRLAKEIAEDSSRAKSEFLANMSHEIRTPMNGIIGITNLALKHETTETQRAYLLRIDISAKSLLRIINDILDFSKVEAGKLEVERSEFRIDTVINDVRNITAFYVNQKGIGFHTDISPDIDFNLIGDSLRLQQVLLNITNNAVKFTHSGNVSINVSVSDRDEHMAELLFTVQDTGIGMAKEQAAKVFEAFGQGDASTTRKYGGTGLGLAICKALVELMGGRIWFESEPNAGTTFFFTVKMEITQARDLSSGLYFDDSSRLVSPEYQGAYILLVEDNEINQIVASEVLENAGFNVDIACSGDEAISMIMHHAYDLILMDIQMPIMDGLTATRLIRANRKFRQVPIIAMTANAMQGDRERSLEAGMNDHITKPLDPELFLNKICQWLERGEF